MPAVETKPVLSSEELQIVKGLSPQDQVLVLRKIEQGRRLAQILEPFSNVENNVFIPVVREVRRGSTQAVLEAQDVKLHALRKVRGALRETLCAYGLEHAARTIFEAPEREEHDLSYKEAISQLAQNAS